MNKKIALISVYDKTNIEKLAKCLINDHNYQIISTGNTRNYLEKKGIETTSITEITEFPEILNGRVKTLHPKIQGGILADIENNEHISTLKTHNINPINLVVVNLYPFEEIIEKDTVSEEDLIENIDIGGHTLLRSAAKNFKNVTTVCSQEDYNLLINELSKYKGNTTIETRKKLALKAFYHVLNYDKIIYKTLKEKFNNNTQDNNYEITLKKIKDLRYGENPHQKAALYLDANSNNNDLPFKLLQGKELSYNNIVDLTTAVKIINEFKEIPVACIIKHNNPCGVALGKTVFEAYNKALSADPVSAFGGIVGTNKTIDTETAKLMTGIFLELIVAPEFTEEALSILSKKKNLRVIKMPIPPKTSDKEIIKQVIGGILIQDADTKIISKEDFNIVSKKKPSEAELDDLLFAWKISKHVSSNAIVIAKNAKTIGIGCGQTSRIASMEIALRQACDEAKDAVIASDGFIPAIDNIQAAVQSRISAIIQPGGSIKDQEVTNMADKYNLAMIHTGYRHFKH